jgi:excisionase family DNA binding protein
MTIAELPAAPPTPKLLRVREVAAALGVSRNTVWALISAGKLKAVRIGSRATRVSFTELTRYTEALPEVRISQQPAEGA